MKRISLQWVHSTCRNHSSSVYYCIIIYICSFSNDGYVNKEFIGPLKGRSPFVFYKNKQTTQIWRSTKSVAKPTANGWTDAGNNEIRNIRYA